MLEFITRLAAMADEREEGQALVEYALILGLVSVVAIGILGTIGGQVNGVLGAVSAALATVPGA
jgi:Flp pilus assembly pilin Flp